VDLDLFGRSEAVDRAPRQRDHAIARGRSEEPANQRTADAPVAPMTTAAYDDLLTTVAAIDLRDPAVPPFPAIPPI
jgi:hypothetical protein